MRGMARSHPWFPIAGVTARRRVDGVPLFARLVYVVARAVSAACIITLAALVVFDARAERLTSGTMPPQFRQPLRGAVGSRDRRITVVAHNAGDDPGAATRAVAYGADAIEIDVRSAGDELLASHDAPMPVLEDVFFRGPSLAEAWDVARLRGTVLLHLKERTMPYLARIRSFLAAQSPRRIIVQTQFADSIASVRRLLPDAELLFLIVGRADLARVRSDAALRRDIDGVSIREPLLTARAQAWLKHAGLATFAWTVNDEGRLHQLIHRGVDGVITDRLDIMQLLGTGPEAVE
jgi:glycerophosphoryl diester phosphodiesterase